MKKRRIIIIFASIIGVLGSLILINFIPTFWLKTSEMKMFPGEWVNVYYEKNYDAAVDVFELADGEAEYLAEKLGISGKHKINIYIYDSQEVMQRKKYGLIVNFLNLDWYIGDFKGTNVLLTSPATQVKGHTYNSIKGAILHEMVHAYITIFNPRIQLWLTDATALYLTNGQPFSRDLLQVMRIPSKSDMKTNNPVKYSNIGGYTFANTYIEYLDKEYGWDKVLELLHTENYDEVFGHSYSKIYNEWVHYLRNY